MSTSARQYLATGVVTVAATAIAVAPVHAPVPEAFTSRSIELRAAVQPLVAPPNTAAAVLGRIDQIEAAATPGPAAARSAPSQTQTSVQAQAAVQANNAASDAIDSVYAVARYWANYVSLELGPWLINWVPFGYLISDQIYIWYPTFTLPVVDSFVYDFLDPVVNDPLNPAVWSEGLTAIANTAANGISSGITQEINYLVSLQWFPIPLPPLPSLPSLPLPAATTTLAAPQAAAVDTTAAEGQSDDSVTSDDVVTAATGHSARGQLADGLPAGPAAATQDVVGAAGQAGSDIADANASADEAVTAAAHPVATTVATTARQRATEAKAGVDQAVKALAEAPDTVAKGIVTAQGEVRGAVQKAASAIATAKTGDRTTVRATARPAQSTPKTGVRTGAHTATGGVQNAGGNAVKAEKAAHSTGKN